MEENQQVEPSPSTETGTSTEPSNTETGETTETSESVEQNTQAGQEETSSPETEGTEGEQVEDPSAIQDAGPLMVEIQRPHTNVVTAIDPEGEVEQEFNIIHEVTLGDLLISTLLLAILLTNLISRVVRR